MPVKHPFNIYREQLWPIHHGFALWRPNPVEGIYNQVSIGDVGYIYEGGFIRMFNVTLPWNDESNKLLGEPCRYDQLSSDSFAVRRETFGKVDYYSRRVSREETVGNTQAASPDEAEYVTYRCRGRGAVLSLPNGGLRQDVIHTKVFQKYISDNVATWLNWSKDKGLPVKSMEDLVFVYGCTLVSSWAAAAFDDYTGDAQLSLASRTLDSGAAGFTWSNIRGTVEYHDSQLNPDTPYLPQSRCVFVKCLRAKRVLFRIISYYMLAAESDDEASHDADEASSHSSTASFPYDPNGPRGSVTQSTGDSDDEASHDADEAFSHASAAPFPCDPNGPRGSVTQSTGDSDDEASHDADEAFSHASAASFPYDPNGPRGSVTQSTGDSEDSEYLDPLIGVLRYVAAEIRANGAIPQAESAMAVANDNDLQLIEPMDFLTGDVAVENFLHKNRIPVLLENGVMALQVNGRRDRWFPCCTIG